MNWTTMRNGILAGAMLVAAGAQAQTTNAWVPVTGTNAWNTAGNWSLGTVPNADTAVASFTYSNYLESIGATLASDITLNGLIFDDWGATDAQRLTIANNQITFAGISPFIVNSNDFEGRIMIDSTVRVENVTLTLRGKSVSTVNFRGPLVGNGTLVVTQAQVQVLGLNSNFTGSIEVRGGAATYFDGVGGGALNQYWSFGDTNGATYVYGEARVRPMRDSVNVSNAEPFHLYGVNAGGSLSFASTANVKYQGVVTLHTNGVIGYSPNVGVDVPTGVRKDVFFNGTIQDDGENRNLHFLQSSSDSGSGTLTRTSRMILGGTATHGGFTHVSNMRTPDPDGTQYSGWLQLTNGNNRLSTGTTLYLGGLTNSGTLTIGMTGANGVLILSGANQELAGLYVLGTGSQSRVIGGMPTPSTLTLNIAAGTTNLYRGFLGGAGTDENNLALTKKGAGLLNLTNVNTFTGLTTVEAGTLRIGGSHAGPTTVKTGGTLNVVGTHTLGLITVENGGTLGGIGTVGAITSSGTVSPGNSVGTLTANGNVTLVAGATLLIDINEFLNDEYDKLVMAGGAGNNTLNLDAYPNLTINLNYTPGLGDYFTIVSGMGINPSFWGSFSGKPDLGTFDVSGTTFQIDYTDTDIRLTVVPEPQTLGLLGLAALGGLLRRRIRR